MAQQSVKPAGARFMTCAGCLILAVSLAGCGGAAPSAAFVAQADRLHNEWLATTLVRDSDLRDYVSLVGRRIVKAAGGDRGAALGGVRFDLVACPVPNAFGTGGNHLYVTSGLLRSCASEDDLAAAVAHACAHAADLDVERLGFQPDPNRPLRTAAWQFVTHRFTLEQERRADELAFALYRDAGYDPRRFAEIFERLAVRDAAAGSPDRLDPAERVRRSDAWARDAKAARRPLPVADPQTFQSLHRQAEAVAAPAPSAGETFLQAFPNCLLPGDTPLQQQAQQVLRPPQPTQVPLEPS